jgi:4-hydroxy-2-oxoheptanedioate aldolase
LPRSLAERFAAGESLLSGWCTLPEPLVAEAVARAGFDAVTLDMQHGLIDLAAACRLIPAVRHAGSRVGVRIPVGGFQIAAQLLDSGADMVIAPMIETVEDARAFGAFTKYAPLGQRSWGPTRAVQLASYLDDPGITSDAYRRRANGDTLAIVMIETRKALSAVEDLLALPEIDGVLVGPSDLSLALSDGAALDVDAPASIAAFEHVLRCAKAAGKHASIYATSGAHAKRYRDIGYSFVAMMADIVYLTAGAKAAIAEVR